MRIITNSSHLPAVAARPSSAVYGYLLGGLCWFSIPFFLATTLGLAAVALEDDPSFPTYPNHMTSADVGAGLVAPNAAVALLGSSGAVAILILVFLAVTSAASAELIAVSSLLTYDVYRTYIKPDATGAEIMRVSHINTVGFGIFMGVLASVLNNFGITLGYLYLLMGIIVAPAVIPIAFTLTWKDQNANGAIYGSILAFCFGLITWLSTAKGLFGKVDLVRVLSPSVLKSIVVYCFPRYMFRTAQERTCPCLRAISCPYSPHS